MSCIGGWMRRQQQSWSESCARIIQAYVNHLADLFVTIFGNTVHMFKKKKFITVLALVALVIAGVAAVKAPTGKDRNLQVLPKNISDQKLDSIMHTYNIALGVTCKFCHVPMKDLPDSLDYPSDAEPMKENARKMMRMVIYINKTNFYFDKNVEPEYLHTVTCKTCHRGEPLPPE